MTVRQMQQNCIQISIEEFYLYIYVREPIACELYNALTKGMKPTLWIE